MNHPTESIEAGRDQVHDRLRPGEHRLKHHEQDYQQNDEPSDRMEQDGVEPSCQRVGRWLGDGGAENAIRLALGRAQLAGRRRLP